MVAYSTLAQLGYLFLMFPLAVDPVTGALVSGDALTAGMVQAVSHATAKAAMFLAAGAIYAALGHDRVAGLAGVARALPVPVLAFVVGGVALTGVAPSGAGIAKKLLLDAAATTDQRLFALVLQAGAFFTAGYTLLVLAHALARPAEPVAVRPGASRAGHAAALALALASLLLGLGALGPWLPRSALSNPLAPAELWSTALLVGGGAVLGVALGRTLPRRWSGAVAARIRGIGGPVGAACERADRVLRHWPAACAALLALVVAFGALMRPAAP
jgi:NADH:ubiquinone oxidoreductase subunit 5 (subunit L)/multisubunit Na+/H+ antiporter MnhA subunit